MPKFPNPQYFINSQGSEFSLTNSEMVKPILEKHNSMESKNYAMPINTYSISSPFDRYAGNNSYNNKIMTTQPTKKNVRVNSNPFTKVIKKKNAGSNILFQFTGNSVNTSQDPGSTQQKQSINQHNPLSPLTLEHQ